MTSNADNAMARFLFAILKQKNLKDVSSGHLLQTTLVLLL